MTDPTPAVPCLPVSVDDPREPTPVGFRGKLYAPQAALLRRMMRLEACGEIDVGEGRRIRTSAARVSEKLSFGKTVLCVALVATRVQPTPRPRDISYGISSLLSRDAYTGRNGDVAPEGPRMAGNVRVRYGRRINATLVIAATSVIGQWEKSFRTFTPHLTYFTLDGIDAFERFVGELDSGTFAAHVVFVKVGSLTERFSSVARPGAQWVARQAGQVQGPANEMHYWRTVEAVVAATAGATWNRLIIDDFDTARLTNRDPTPAADFTWYISATLRSMSPTSWTFHARTAREARAGDSSAAVAYFRAMLERTPLVTACRDEFIDSHLKLHCDEAFVAAHLTSTVVEYRDVFLKGGISVEVLQDLDVPPEVLEMISAGAIDTAASSLGIRANSAGDIVRRVLEIQLDTAARARFTIAACERIAAALGEHGCRHQLCPDTLRRAVEDRPVDAGGALADRLVLALEGRDTGHFAAAGGQPGLGPSAAKAQLGKHREKATERLKKSTTRLGRMRDNIREQACQVCMIDFEEGEESYILNCCQVVACRPCVLAGAGGRGAFIRRCPNCAVDLAPEMFIYVGAEISLDRVLDDGVVDEAADEAARQRRAAAERLRAPAAAEAAVDFHEEERLAAKYEPWRDNVRLEWFLRFASGDPAPREGVVKDEYPVNPPGAAYLLEGVRDVPQPPDTVRKVVVFTMFPEASCKIMAALETLGVGVGILNGPRRKKEEELARFREATSARVLVITSAHDCSGIDLPEATAVVMYHHHHSAEIAAQAIGRAQRLGRTCNLKFVRLCDEGERRRFGA